MLRVSAFGALPRPINVFLACVYLLVGLMFYAMSVVIFDGLKWMALYCLFSALNQFTASMVSRSSIRFFYELAELMDWDVGETTNERELRKKGLR